MKKVGVENSTITIRPPIFVTRSDPSCFSNQMKLLSHQMCYPERAVSKHRLLQNLNMVVFSFRLPTFPQKNPSRLLLPLLYVMAHLKSQGLQQYREFSSLVSGQLSLQLSFARLSFFPNSISRSRDRSVALLHQTLRRPPRDLFLNLLDSRGHHLGRYACSTTRDEG